ncbi:MAG: glycosyltransferase family 9 protein [Deltaproteobacteria bacterium]|nr:glycosyltransferase family 9 protein [Deltaproteobacteria bacterium]
MSRIVIIRPSALGDTLLLAPALRELNNSNEIKLIGRFPGIEFLKPFLSHCIDYEGGGWHTIFSEKPNCEKIPTVASDIVISFLTDPNGIAQRGLQGCFENIPIQAFPPFPKKGENIHTALYLASCLKNSGLSLDPKKAFEDAVKKPLFMDQGQPIRKKNIVIHPGSGSKTKNYPSDFWLELIKGLDRTLVNNLTVLAGPAELSWQNDLINNVEACGINIIKSPSAEGLLSMFKKTYLYIGLDSGVTHLAAMSGVRTIALFKSSSIDQWAPLGPKVTIFQNVKSPNIIHEALKKFEQHL